MFRPPRSRHRLPWGLALLLVLTLAVRAAGGPAPSAAGPVVPDADPLGFLVSEALRANLSLEGERLAERRSAAEVRQAIGLYLPRVDVDSRYSDLHGVQNLGDLVNPAYAALNQLTGTSAFPTNVDLTFPQAHETRLRVSQPLLAEGLRANISVARARHDVQRLELGAAARQIAAATQLAYLKHASARRVVEIQESTLDLVRENERVAQRLLDAGRATPEAVLRARADRAAVEQHLAEAREREAAAARELNRILHRPLESSVEVLPDEAFDRPLPLDADAAVAHALAAREELLAGDAGVRVAEAAKRAATSRFLPSVSFALDYGFQGRDFEFTSDEDYWAASVVAQWELLGVDRHAARSAAGYEAERARNARADLADAIRVEARTAHDAAAVAQAAIVTADARLDAARRTFELVRRRYEEGAASPVEWVDARTTLTSAELNRALTAYEYAMRWVDLERAAALRDVSF